MYYNTLFEKKQPFFVRKFKFLILFSPFRYNPLIFAQEKVSFFVNFSIPLVVDKNRHTRCRFGEWRMVNGEWFRAGYARTQFILKTKTHSVS